MKIKAIITGATGMIGEGVLHECLLCPDVEQVLVINRRPCNVTHEKLTEIILPDFFNLTPVAERLHGYNACFFCLGISSVGMKEPEYRRITYDLTLNFAHILVSRNPGMVFCYVSGAGTDSSEKGRLMWARVKGKTENDLLKLPFRDSYMFRPGLIRPTKGLRNAYSIYKIINPLFPLLKLAFPKFVTTLKDIGIAMIQAACKGYDKKVLEVKDIVKLARD
jgi:nucleoside-diphosphate-sugar epimerase